MNEIKIFEKEEFGQIRTAISESGEPLFCLADVCKAIGISNHRNVVKRLDAGDVHRVDSPTKTRISAFKSKKPKCGIVVHLMTKSALHEKLE